MWKRNNNKAKWYVIVKCLFFQVFTYPWSVSPSTAIARLLSSCTMGRISHHWLSWKPSVTLKCPATVDSVKNYHVSSSWVSSWKHVLKTMKKIKFKNYVGVVILLSYYISLPIWLYQNLSFLYMIKNYKPHFY
jgi:hypothetical protein